MARSGIRLHKQTALVTGGNSGIGRAIVEAFAAAGASVAINYITDEQTTNSMIESIRANGGRAIGVKADVADERQVEEMFSRVVDAFGALDILVNNAGIQRDAPLQDMTLDEWNQVLDVNLTGQFLCSRAAAQQFMKQGIREDISVACGKIICISSVHQAIPWAGHANYAASKGGVMQFMRSIAQSLAEHHIRVNAIAPGAIKTPINRDAWETPEARDRLNALIPYGRIGEPEDIGNAAVWLASDESDYVCGTTLFVDGGMTLYPGFAPGTG